MIPPEVHERELAADLEAEEMARAPGLVRHGGRGGILQLPPLRDAPGKKGK